MNKKKISILVASIVISSSLLGGCGLRPYERPEIHTITPSQTAFLIPLDGKTSKQGVFKSEEMLSKAKVPSKRIEIPHRWLKEGRMHSSGKYIATEQLIIVERKPVTRAWTESSSNGTSTKNEGIVAESKESIGFMARMNCSAQIDEQNAVKFLYRYNNKPLEKIMDTEIRSRIESKFVEQCSQKTLEEILRNKGKIMDTVRKDVIAYFKERGITITTLGLKGEFTYLDNNIQTSINKKFTAQKSLEAQKAENERTVSKAKADAEAIKIQSETIKEQIKLKELENQEKWIQKWNGQTPQVQGTNSVIYGMPKNTK